MLSLLEWLRVNGRQPVDRFQVTGCCGAAGGPWAQDSQQSSSSSHQPELLLAEQRKSSRFFRHATRKAASDAEPTTRETLFGILSLWEMEQVMLCWEIDWWPVYRPAAKRCYRKPKRMERLKPGDLANIPKEMSLHKRARTLNVSNSLIQWLDSFVHSQPIRTGS